VPLKGILLVPSLLDGGGNRVGVAKITCNYKILPHVKLPLAPSHQGGELLMPTFLRYF
jgi:hypothetical protein